MSGNLRESDTTLLKMYLKFFGILEIIFIIISGFSNLQLLEQK